MTKETEKLWITYNNIAENKGGFLHINIFQKENERNQKAIEILKKQRNTMDWSILRPSAVVACDYASVTRHEIAKKFNLSSSDDYGGALGKWADSKHHTLKYHQEAIDGLIELCEDKLKTVDDRLRVQLIHNDDPDDDDPWYTPFILTSKGGFFTGGWGDDPTDNIFYRISDDTFKVVAGKNSITIKIDGDELLYEDNILYQGSTQRRQRQEIFRLGPSPY